MHSTHMHIPMNWQLFASASSSAINNILAESVSIEGLISHKRLLLDNFEELKVGTLVGAVHDSPVIHSLWVNGVEVNARLSITEENCHCKLNPSS